MLHKWHQSTNPSALPTYRPFTAIVCGAWRSVLYGCGICVAHHQTRDDSLCKALPVWWAAHDGPHCGQQHRARNGGWSPERCEWGHEERLQLSLHPQPSILAQRTEQASFSLVTILLWWISIKCQCLFFYSVFHPTEHWCFCKYLFSFSMYLKRT